MVRFEVSVAEKKRCADDFVFDSWQYGGEKEMLISHSDKRLLYQ